MFGSTEPVNTTQKQLKFNYFQALENVNTNVFIANTEFQIVFVNAKSRVTLQSINRQIKESFGIEAHQVMGANIDIFHADRAQQIRNMLSDKSNFPIHSEISFSDLILELNISEITEDGKLQGYVVNWEEISEKKAAANNAARATSVFEGAPINIMVANHEGIITDLNPKSLATLKTIEHLLPIKADEVLGASYDVFHKDPAHQRKLLADPNNLPYQAFIHIGDEVLDLNASPMYDGEGNYTGPMVTWDVVTKKFAVESSNRTNLQMLDYAPINMMRADLDFKITYINQNSKKVLKTLEEFLPVKVEEIVGSSIDIFHKNPDRQRELLSNPANLPYKTKFKLGPETLALQAHPLTDENGDYIGPMVTWDVITERDYLVQNLTDTALKLSAASEELSSSATQMIDNAQNTTNQATTAATASEEISAGIANVAASMEEMTSSIREITSKTNEASTMSSDAKGKAHSTNTTINNLGESSLDIGNVIKVISSIAQQTNLLALNATIEAARAGEAGKGFAVVANEVKELAKETSEATQEITKKIESIQSDSNLAVGAISGVNQAIESIDEINTNIAASVEEQAATTNEVARISTEATQATTEITNNVNQVVQLSETTLTAARETKGASENLASLAQSLSQIVDELKSKE